MSCFIKQCRLQHSDKTIKIKPWKLCSTMGLCKAAKLALNCIKKLFILCMCSTYQADVQKKKKKFSYMIPTNNESV